MGFKRSKKVYKLVFTGEYEGLEVRATSMPLGEYMAIAKMMDMDTSNPDSQDLGQLDALFEKFANALVWWNLEDDNGQPIPATVAGLYTQDLEFVLTIIMQWVNAVTGVAAPLEQPSSSGSPSLEASLPMEALF